MMDEQGGAAADKWANLEVGGRVLVRDEWCTIIKVNKSGGIVNSLTTNRRYVEKVGIEMVKDYQPPTPEEAATVKKATKLPPMCNYPGEGFCRMTKADYAKVYTDHKSGHYVKPTDTSDGHRVRSVQSFIARRFGVTDAPQWGSVCVYLTDEKRKDPPAKSGEVKPVVPRPERTIDATPAHTPHTPPKQTPPEIEAMKESIKAGVQVVSAPQLFPTPPEIAEKMVELAEIKPGHTVLEPSAGTGSIAKAIRDAEPLAHLDCIEINASLCKILEAQKFEVLQYDFLETVQPYCPDSAEGHDRVVMNPPFENGADIKHIRHALGMLKPGGKLVALCANGPRQREAFMNEAICWENLPAGSFKSEGTGVNVALMVLAA